MRIVKFFFFLDSQFSKLFFSFISETRILRIDCAKARLLWTDRLKITSDKSSHSQMFFKTAHLKNSAIFTRKHLYWSFFFNEVALMFFFKKRLQQVFSWQCCKIFENSFCYRTLLAAFGLITVTSCAISWVCISII